MKCLSPLKSVIKEYKIVSFDTETYTKYNKFILCGVFTDKYRKFFNQDLAIKFIKDSLDKDSLIFATNLSFDFNTLFYNNKEFLDYDFIMKGSDYIMCRNKEQIFLDTFNISPSSVKSLGNMLGFKKLSQPHFLGKYPINKYQWKELIRYNKRDCEISKKFIEYFQKAINELGGELKSTIASTSMELFRRRFLKTPIYHENFNCKTLIFKSYYGGRTEVFSRGTIKDYYYYDYNSLYPSVMLKEFPKPSSAIKIKDFKNIISLINKYHGITDVLIKTPKYMKYPLLPYRSKNGKLLFPLGIFRGVYTNHELRKALELGYTIIKAYNSIIYTKTFYPFKDYVKTLYELRIKYKNENNFIMQYACKILLNSLYGKFGQRHFDKIIFNHPNINDFSLKDIEYTIIKKDEERNFIIPIFASYVTSYARLKLYDSIIKYNPIYCDTDSIFIKEKLEDNHDLGELKLEKHIEKGIIIKPKAYFIKSEYGEEIKFKGLKHLDYKDFNKILNNKPVIKEKFIKIKEAIIQKLYINEIRNISKEINLEDDKRQWKWKFSTRRMQESKPLIVNDYILH